MPETQLSPKQCQVIALLLKGERICDIAKKLKMGEKTIDRWLKNDEFNIRLQTEKERIIEAAFSKLASHADDAIDYLGAVVNNDDLSTRDRLNAAKSILANIEKLFVSEQSRRNTELERLIDAILKDFDEQ